MCRILILADIRPMGITFLAVVGFGLGKNLLLKNLFSDAVTTLPTAEMLSGKNCTAMGLIGFIFQKINEN